MSLASEHEALARLERGLAGRYVIEREVGRGASARVFLARDLKHERNVALKLLRPELSAVVGSERFLREIRVTATLQHPNILPLYDSGEADGLLYFVTPYVEGMSLRARLEREHQLPVDEAVALLRALAGALDFAHRQGVVHRDLKPENILLQDGQPLLADFGIALALTSAAGDRLTETGLSVGTLQYMSPEQAAGDRTVGPPSDIYSLGAVAYEMLSGEPPVSGSTAEAIRARVLLQMPPPIRVVRQTVPEPVDAAVLKALAKVPADRFRTAAAFGAALGQTAPAPASTISAALRGGRRAKRIAIVAVAAIVVVMTTLVVGPRVMPTRASPAIRRQLTFSGRALQATLSPNGQFVAYTIDADSTEFALVQDLAGGAPDTIDSFSHHHTMDWSPDGTRLLLGSVDRAVIVPRLGGTRRVLSGQVLEPSLARWLPDGARVSFTHPTKQQITVLDLESGDTVSIATRGSDGALFNEGSWSPDGRLYAVSTQVLEPVRFEIRVVGLDGAMAVVAADSIPLGSPRWSGGGHAMYYVRGTNSIWRVLVVPQTGQPRGAAQEVLANLDILPIYWDFVFFSIAPDQSRMVYSRGSRFSNFWMVEASSAGGPPRTRVLTSGTALRRSPVVSPDGRWIAFVQEANGSDELFRMPIDGGEATQVTFGARVVAGGDIAWSPEGDRIAFMSIRGGYHRVWAAQVSDGRLAVFNRSRALYKGHMAWAPGSRIVYQSPNALAINVLDPATGEEHPLLTTLDGGLYSPRYSPDGNRLAVWWSRGRGDRANWIFDIRDSTYVNPKPIPGPSPIGWTADGRYVYGGGTRISRMDALGRRGRETVVDLPFREARCTPAGRLRPNAFICAAFDFVSDIWMIENFDSPHR